MDLTSLMSTLLSDDAITSVSEKSGVSAMDAASVLTAVLPMLLSGANAQASRGDTAESFEKAASDHAGRKDDVSLEEGEKIVRHLLGDEAEKTQKAIARSTGLSKNQVLLILAAAAPLLMKLLGSNSAQNSQANSQQGYLGGTGSMLGSLLGGSSTGLFGSSNSNALSNALMGAALGSVLSGAMSGNTSGQGANNSLLGNLLGSAAQTSYSQPSSSGLLGSLLGASMNANAPFAPAQNTNTLFSAPAQTNNAASGGFGLTDLLTSLLK